MKKASSRKRRRSPGSGRLHKGTHLRLPKTRGKHIALPLHAMEITDFYRPLKKPVTLRLDADVIAWFKKDGRRYQTRINAALRKVMAREMKERG